MVVVVVVAVLVVAVVVEIAVVLWLINNIPTINQYQVKMTGALNLISFNDCDFLALLVFTPQCYRRGEGVCRRPLTQASQKLLHGSRPNFMERYLHVSTLSPDTLYCFLFGEFANCYDFSFWLIRDPMGRKVLKYATFENA